MRSSRSSSPTYVACKAPLAPALLGLALLALALPGAAAAGTVEGTVVYSGAVPDLPTLDMSGDPLCAELHDRVVTSSVLVLGTASSGGHTLGNVLIQITGSLPTGPPAGGSVVLDQAGCVYSPRVVVLRPGQTLEVRNPDGIMHTVHFEPKENDEKNLAMPPFLKQAKVEFSQPEPAFSVKCDMHLWMKAWVAILDHPYFAVTGADGHFAIDGLPVGTYTAVAWHEKLGTVSSEFTVAGNETTTVELVLSRP